MTLTIRSIRRTAAKCVCGWVTTWSLNVTIMNTSNGISLTQTLHLTSGPPRLILTVIHGPKNYINVCILLTFVFMIYPQVSCLYLLPANLNLT
jgi:hypothetical protein